jgi:hypothetical protein
MRIDRNVTCELLRRTWFLQAEYDKPSLPAAVGILLLGIAERARPANTNLAYEIIGKTTLGILGEELRWG